MGIIRLTTIEWSGSLLALIGSGLLASNTKASGLGFVFFAVSNIFWMMFAIQTHANGLLFMQCGFLATSIFGVYRWGHPKQQHAVSVLPPTAISPAMASER